MNPLLGIGLGAGLFGDIGKLIFGGHQAHLAKQINPVFTQYQTSPYAKQQLGIAQQLFNAPMAGYQQQLQNIYGSQANYLNAAQRGATDSGQLLALGGLAQGQTNQALNQLGIQNAQNKYNMLNNLNSAYQSMINEGNKVYQSQLEKYQMDVAQKNALTNAGMQNIFGGIGDISAGFLQAYQLENPNGASGSSMRTTGNNPYVQSNIYNQ